MRTAYDVETVRAAERALMLRVPEGALMQRAAVGLAGATATALGRVYGARVVLLVGSGDNGGDALYAGARLAGRGARVDAIALDPQRAHAGGVQALRRAGGRLTTDPAVLDRADVVLDGIVGIGGKGGLRPEAATLVAQADAGTGLMVAVDVPSGVDASTGEVEGDAVRADVTVTFGALKTGLLVAPGADHAGTVHLVDIGLGPDLPAAAATGAVSALQAADVAALLPRPGYQQDKYQRGVLGVVAGSDSYTGAAVLTVGGALRAGVGMVRFVSVDRPVELVRQRWPEAVTTIAGRDPASVADAGRVQAWVVGPGLGQDEDADTMLRAVLSADVPVLVDADGLNLLAGAREPLELRTAPTLLTPHAGELARLLGVPRSDVEARASTYAHRAADELDATVLLKGATTLVAAPGGQARVNPTGTSWLGTAGSGDVLSGFVGALLASGLSPLDAGAVGAWMHGLIARRLSVADTPLIAEDLVHGWPDAVRAVHS